jgi:hypothetical protein
MTTKETGWEELVDEGKRLATADRGGAAFALGDLALAVVPVGKEGIKTGALDRLVKYAEAIDVPFGTLRQYRQVAAAWPAVTRVTAAPFKAHRLLAGEPDRVDLINDGYRSPTAIAGLLAERHPKLAPKRDERWWHAEREAARLLRQFDVKRMLAGWSNTDKRRAVALIREHIKQEEEVARQIERKAETHRL